MTDGSGIDHREYNKSNEEADRLGKEGAGLESSADLIKDWSGGYHSFFFWRNL